MSWNSNLPFLHTLHYFSLIFTMFFSFSCWFSLFFLLVRSVWDWIEGGVGVWGEKVVYAPISYMREMDQESFLPSSLSNEWFQTFLILFCNTEKFSDVKLLRDPNFLLFLSLLPSLWLPNLKLSSCMTWFNKIDPLKEFEEVWVSSLELCHTKKTNCHATFQIFNFGSAFTLNKSLWWWAERKRKL